LGRCLPWLAASDALENSRCPGAISSAPAIAGCESFRERVGANAILVEERFGEIESHLGIVGPAKAPVGCSPDKTPHEPLKQTTLVRCAEGIAGSKAEHAAGESVKGEVHGARVSMNFRRTCKYDESFCLCGTKGIILHSTDLVGRSRMYR